MNENKQLFENINLDNQEYEKQDVVVNYVTESVEPEKSKTSIWGVAVVGFAFTITIIFSFIGFIVSLIAVIRGIIIKKKQKNAQIKGLYLSIISLFLSIVIITSSVVVPILFWDDIVSIANELGITDIIPIESSSKQKDLCLQIEKSLSVNEIDKAVALSSQLKQPLTEKEERIVMVALTQRINSRIQSFTKSFGSTECLISDDVIQEIQKYITITYYAGVTYSDNTNVINYLNLVYDLEKYSKYNDYWAYYNSTIDDWNAANLYWESACDSYSDYMKNQHLSKALNHFNACLSRTYDFNSSNFGISEARDFLQIYINKINYYYNTGNDLSIDYSVLTKYENTTDEFIKETKDFINKIKSLPTSVYYN